MTHLTLNRVPDLALPMGMVRQIAQLNETKGRQELFRAQKPEVLEGLRQIAIIHSTESSNRLENVIVERGRLAEVLADRVLPRDRPEAEVAGYRDALRTLHHSWEHIPPTVNHIRQLHRDLYRYTNVPGGRFKQVDNRIEARYPDGTVVIRFAETTPAHLTDGAMEAMSGAFLRMRQSGAADDLVLVAAFVLDFLCIHPFGDGNGRMARLLSLLLLYQVGHEVGRYISLERLIEETKETYYEALYNSSTGWAKGENDLMPWLSYFLGVLIRGCGELEERVRSATGTKSDLVRQAVAHLPQPFTFKNAADACPTISPATIRKVIEELRRAGRITLISRGRNASWRRVDED